jgi:hypothetical protein
MLVNFVGDGMAGDEDGGKKREMIPSYLLFSTRLHSFSVAIYNKEYYTDS